MKFCTWGNIASAVEGKPVGGGELQIAMLCKVLAASGHEVVIVDTKVEKDYVTKEGIKIVKVQGWDDGIRFLRFITHRLPLLYKYLKNQKADIYYCQIRDYTHVLAYMAARRSKGKFVIQLASDLDALNLRLRMKYDYLTNLDGGLWWFVKAPLNEIIFPRLVRKADLTLVQHEGQKESLAKKGIKSEIFYNLIDISGLNINHDAIRDSYCYVGSLDRRKGFPQFYELAGKASSVKFKVIGKPRDRTGYLYYEKIKALGNVTLYGKLTHPEAIEHISNSRGLVSTSPMEGFPNIFVEAWACGTPVYSLYFDPGATIEKLNIGFNAKGDIDKLAQLLAVNEEHPGMRERSREYVLNHHALTENKIKEINTLFENLCKG